LQGAVVAGWHLHILSLPCPRIHRTAFTMIEFYGALAVFLAAHVIPASPGLRARLIDAMGRSTYLITYSILSLVLLGWLIVAA
jgi:hypothetical protein